MQEYRIIKNDDSKILLRLNKKGVYKLIATIYLNDNTLMLENENAISSYRFKCNNKNVKFKNINGVYIAFLENENVTLYRKPNHNILHRVIMSENYNRFSFANAKYMQNKKDENLNDIVLDTEGISENMLEFATEF